MPIFIFDPGLRNLHSELPKSLFLILSGNHLFSFLFFLAGYDPARGTSSTIKQLSRYLSIATIPKKEFCLSITTATNHSSRYRGGLLINPIFSEMWIWVKRCHFDFSLRATTHVMHNAPRTSRIVDYWLLISILTSMSFKGTHVRGPNSNRRRIQR